VTNFYTEIDKKKMLILYANQKKTENSWRDNRKSLDAHAQWQLLTSRWSWRRLWAFKTRIHFPKLLQLAYITSDYFLSATEPHFSARRRSETWHTKHTSNDCMICPMQITALDRPSVFLV